MKTLILLSLLSSTAFARPVILVSHYDAFGQAKFNNSENVARMVSEKVNAKNLNYEIKLCALSTVFDKAYGQIENCIKENPETVMILGLGETGCDLKIETMMRNKDKTFGPDNEGNERKNTPIIPGGEEALGLTYPLPSMYCALSSEERKDLVVSNNAGSFVCNNTAYQLSHFYPEVSSGFIHVPANFCSNLPERTQKAVASLTKMLSSLGDITAKRLPVKKKELEFMRKGSDKCLNDFYKRYKGVDEKSFWQKSMDSE